MFFPRMEKTFEIEAVVAADMVYRAQGYKEVKRVTGKDEREGGLSDFGKSQNARSRHFGWRKYHAASGEVHGVILYGSVFYKEGGNCKGLHQTGVRS